MVRHHGHASGALRYLFCDAGHLANRSAPHHTAPPTGAPVLLRMVCASVGGKMLPTPRSPQLSHRCAGDVSDLHQLRYDGAAAGARRTGSTDQRQHSGLHISPDADISLSGSFFSQKVPAKRRLLFSDLPRRPHGIHLSDDANVPHGIPLGSVPSSIPHRLVFHSSYLLRTKTAAALPHACRMRGATLQTASCMSRECTSPLTRKTGFSAQILCVSGSF